MIDRTFMPRTKPMTKWPDQDRASVRELCAPLSAMLESPRVSPYEGKGRALALCRLRANVEKIRIENLVPKGTRGKHE